MDERKLADTAADDQAEPVGNGSRIVKAGDSIDSIAQETGHFWQTIWSHPDNAALKQARHSRTVLLPGDRVAIPPLRAKAEHGATDLVHRFTRKGVPAEIRFQVLDAEGKPQAGRNYVLRIGKRRYEGRTDSDGKLHHFVAPDGTDALLSVQMDPNDRTIVKTWQLNVSRLQPVNTVQGMQSRLNNLGYSCGQADGKMGLRTQAALIRFLEDESLPPANGYDGAAQDALRLRHGS